MFKHLNILCDVIERLKAVVKTESDTNETYTARCELPGDEDDWTYSWFIDGSSRAFSTDREFNFISDVFQRRSNVTCRGERKSDGLKSEISDAVTLALSREFDPLHCRNTLRSDDVTRRAFIFTEEKKVVVKI